MDYYNTHNEHIRAIGINNDLIREYGIKGECCLNQLRYFHCVNSFPADVALMFEGVIVDVLTKIIVYCVQSGYFSFADVNEKTKSFPYSCSDKKNVSEPFSISSLTNFKVKLTAIESWNFLRLFPLMFGDCIPRTNIY